MSPARLVQDWSPDHSKKTSTAAEVPTQNVNGTVETVVVRPCVFDALCHPLEKAVTKQVDGWFLTHWPFANDKERKKFVAAAFSQVTCLYFPLSRDDRIALACELLTILFLIDDILEDMSLDDGAEYNSKLMPVMQGTRLPDRDIPVQWMMYDIWERMRACDRDLADEVLEPTFTFMRAQTDKARLSVTGMGPYLAYREKDVGKALLCALMRFSMNLRLTPEELSVVVPIERNCAKHLSVVNDILSWNKEYAAAKTGHVEGSAVCSSVQVLTDEICVPYSASKRVLWAMCREWEVEHTVLLEQLKQSWPSELSASLRTYITGLEYQMSGNELWSKTTLRYNDPLDARAV